MQRSLKRFIGLRLLVFTLVFTLLMIMAQTYRVSAQEQKKNPYLIKVNRVYNTVTIYKMDDNSKYTVPVKAMLCSVGKGGKTTTGTYKTKDKHRWKLLMGDVWGQYATRIVGGILFHSVYYYENNNPATLATKEYNKLGEAASHGCVRLAVQDAKWIYDNCSYGTTVIIYDDKKSPGPLGKPEAIRIANNVRWDPTDPDEKNPFIDKKPTLIGIKNSNVPWGGTYNLKKGMKALSSVGTDITSGVKVKGAFNTEIPGKYKITYTVTDALQKTMSKTITVTVLKNTEAPEFTGITDRVVNSQTTLDADFALTDVEAYCRGYLLDSDSIQVAIDKMNDTQYQITYSASIGKGPVATMTATVTIDDEAPVFAGITDKNLEEDQVPDEAFALSGVTVSDNYSSPENIKVEINISDNGDGTYLVTYTATDEAGNTATAQANLCRNTTTEQPAATANTI